MISRQIQDFFLPIIKWCAGHWACSALVGVFLRTVLWARCQRNKHRSSHSTYLFSDILDPSILQYPSTVWAHKRLMHPQLDPCERNQNLPPLHGMFRWVRCWKISHPDEWLGYLHKKTICIRRLQVSNFNTFLWTCMCLETFVSSGWSR